ncbi:MAG: sugar ABC transporter permease [Propionibacteriaceae bacterium]|nr:sugar ABC transporter permease [Propionibacteriaceae bacterium]
MTTTIAVRPDSGRHRNGSRRGPTHAVARGTWPFLLPAIVASLALVVVPLFFTLWLSVSDARPDGSNHGWVGFANFAQMLADPVFWQSIRVTGFLFITCLIIETVVGILLGYLLSLDVPGRVFMQSLILIPAITAPVAIGLLWSLIFDPTLGAANEILRAIGIGPVPWLGDPAVAPWALVIVDAWQWTPFMALLVSAGIRNLPEEPFEAAAVDGASRWRTALFVGLPMLLPVITVAMLLRTVDLIRFFDSAFVMTQGGPVNSTNTLNILAYREAFMNQHGSYSAAIQVSLLLLVVLVACGFMWLRKKTRYDA